MWQISKVLLYIVLKMIRYILFERYCKKNYNKKKIYIKQKRRKCNFTPCCILNYSPFQMLYLHFQHIWYIFLYCWIDGRWEILVWFIRYRELVSMCLSLKEDNKRKQSTLHHISTHHFWFSNRILLYYMHEKRNFCVCRWNI